jgi:hypothetical protein
MTAPPNAPSARGPLARERADWEMAFAKLSISNRSLFFANFGSYFGRESSDLSSDDIPVDRICEVLASDLFAEFEGDFACEAHSSSGASSVEILDLD